MSQVKLYATKVNIIAFVTKWQTKKYYFAILINIVTFAQKLLRIIL
jgi:hypothetical protein